MLSKQVTLILFLLCSSLPIMGMESGPTFHTKEESTSVPSLKYLARKKIRTTQQQHESVDNLIQRFEAMSFDQLPQELKEYVKTDIFESHDNSIMPSSLHTRLLQKLPEGHRFGYIAIDPWGRWGIAYDQVTRNITLLHLHTTPITSQQIKLLNTDFYLRTVIFNQKSAFIYLITSKEILVVDARNNTVCAGKKLPVLSHVTHKESPDKKYIAFAGSSHVILVALDTFSYTYLPYPTAVNSNTYFYFKFSANGQYLLCYNENDQIWVYDLQTKQLCFESQSLIGTRDLYNYVYHITNDLCALYYKEQDKTLYIKDLKNNTEPQKLVTDINEHKKMLYISDQYVISIITRTIPDGKKEFDIEIVNMYTCEKQTQTILPINNQSIRSEPKHIYPMPHQPDTFLIVCNNGTTMYWKKGTLPRILFQPQDNALILDKHELLKNNTLSLCFCKQNRYYLTNITFAYTIEYDNIRTLLKNIEHYFNANIPTKTVQKMIKKFVKENSQLMQSLGNELAAQIENIRTIEDVRLLLGKAPEGKKNK